MPGFPSSDTGGVTFDNTGTGIPIRSFGSERGARTAAAAAVTPDDGQAFIAVRVFEAGWAPGRVDEYRYDDDTASVTVTERNVLDEFIAACKRLDPS